MRGRVFWNYYKVHMDKMEGEGRSKGRRCVLLGWGEWWGKMQTTIIEQ